MAGEGASGQIRFLTAMLGNTRARASAFADPRQWRARYLAALTHATDRYLRSPLFLTWLRYGFAAVIEAHATQARALSGQRRGKSLGAPPP